LIEKFGSDRRGFARALERANEELEAAKLLRPKSD
jgi:hypothetical protein